MSYTSQRVLACLLPASGFLLCFGLAAQAQTAQPLPVDRPAQVNGIKAACTGIGNGEENEARWSHYPVKLEMVGGYGQWLGDENVTLTGGRTDVSVHCSGPWVLMGLQPGHYRATITVPNAPPKDVAFTVPREGQRDVIVRFHDRMSGQEKTNPM